MRSINSKPIFTSVFAALVALPLLAACEEQGPAEQLGEKIDESVENVGDAAEEATEELQQ